MNQDKGKTANLLPVIRTNNANAGTLNLISCLGKAFPVPPVVVYDGRKGALEFTGAQATALDDARIAAWNMENLPQNWGLMFGDFCYYAAYESFPTFDLYLLVEDDVHLSLKAAHRLCASLDRFHGDATAARLSNTLPQSPRYSKALSDIGMRPNVGCIFPLTVASPRAIQSMRALREKAQTQSNPINDEAIFASAAFEAGMSCQPLETLLDGQLSARTFDTNPPHLAEVLEADPDDVKIWHPVVAFEKVLERIASGEKNYNRHRLRRILRSAPADMKQAIRSALSERVN